MWLSDFEVDFVQQMRDMCENSFSVIVCQLFQFFVMTDMQAKFQHKNEQVHLTTYCACNAVLCRLISMKF